MKNNIELIRKSRGLSQEKLAKLVGTSRGQIDQLEKGERKLHVNWMARIAKALECNPTDLISDTYEADNIDAKSLKGCFKVIERLAEFFDVELSEEEILKGTRELYNTAKRIVTERRNNIKNIQKDQ